MNEIINQLAHGGAFILAAIGFLIFFLTQIWKAVHVDKSYGEKLITVKQPRNDIYPGRRHRRYYPAFYGEKYAKHKYAGELLLSTFGGGDFHRRSAAFLGDTDHQPDKDFHERHSCT